MKKIRIFLILAVAAFITSSCEDDKDIAVLDNENAVASTILTPANGTSYTLTVAEGANEFPFTWSAADYGPTLPYYSNLELDLTTGAFVKPIKVYRTTGELSYIITNAELNLILYDAGVTSTTSAYFRVVTTVKDPNVDTLISPEDKVSITPFAYSKANLSAPADGASFVLKKADSTEPFETFEWNAVDYGAVYENEYAIELDLAGNNFKSPVELVSVKTTSATVTVAAMNIALIKKGIEPGVATQVEFRIVATADGKRGVVKGESITLKLTAYSSDPVDPGGDYPETLHLVGDATDVGWDAANAIPLTNDGDGKFHIIANLKGDEGIEGYKFLVTQGKWAPMYAQDGEGTWDAGNLVLRATEADPDPKALPRPDVTGSYLIELDLAAMTYTVTAQ